MSIEVQVFNDTKEKFTPRKKISSLVENVLKGEKISSASVNIILVTDEKIHEMNKNFLQHDYPTDVITFPLNKKPLQGEIYISLDTARSQSQDYKVTLTNELMRLAAHGALHLAGYDDCTDLERSRMSELESKYMSELEK